MVKTARHDDGLRLDDLAERAGVSKSTLSAIERGEGNPSIETLWRISKALNIQLSGLLATMPPARVRAVPKESGPRVHARSGMEAWLIAEEAGPRRSELFDIELPPGAEQQAEAHPQGATEVVVCTTGSVTVGPVGEEVELKAGDSAWFVADGPHRYAAGKNGARLVNLILTPGGTR